MTRHERDEYIPPTDPKDIERYTSPHVLHEGTAQGWADPADPRDVQGLDERPSVFNEITKDSEGRPINPKAIPGMKGDRGELGRWGVNHAADPVVIATHEVNNKVVRKILLIKRTDGSRQWALPGGMVDPGEAASQTAKRELREEAGIDLATVPSSIVYKGYVNDPRSTINAWIETAASLFVIGHEPQPTADGVETSDARWFDMDSDEFQTLLEEDLYASHGSIVKTAINKLDFDTIMREAQTQHKEGKFDEAFRQWAVAAKLAIDDFDTGRALRGQAASAMRLDYLEPEMVARKALAMHEDTEHAFHEPPEGLRERAESRAVLGRIMLKSVIVNELSGKHSASQAEDAAAEPIQFFDGALQDIREAERMSGQTDQHKINMMSRLAIITSLYGDSALGRAYAQEAIKLGSMSESTQLATKANISLKHRARAKVQSTARGVTAQAINRLAQSGAQRRKVALWLATAKFGI